MKKIFITLALTLGVVFSATTIVKADEVSDMQAQATTIATNVSEQFKSADSTEIVDYFENNRESINNYLDTNRTTVDSLNVKIDNLAHYVQEKGVLNLEYSSIMAIWNDNLTTEQAINLDNQTKDKAINLNGIKGLGTSLKNYFNYVSTQTSPFSKSSTISLKDSLVSVVFLAVLVIAIFSILKAIVNRNVNPLKNQIKYNKQLNKYSKFRY